MMNERISKVRDFILSRGEVTISELQGLYSGYSSMTVWRDLKQLEELGYIRRVHGGVISTQNPALQVEGVYSKRARENTRGRKSPSRKPLYRLFCPGTRSYLDAGSTLMVRCQSPEQRAIYHHYKRRKHCNRAFAAAIPVMCC